MLQGIKGRLILLIITGSGIQLAKWQT